MSGRRSGSDDVHALKFLGKALQNLKDEEYFRLPVGNYRVVSGKKEEELLILVIRIGHRREVHR